MILKKRAGLDRSRKPLIQFAVWAQALFRRGRRRNFLHIFYAWIRNCTLIMRSRAERAASRAPGVFRGAGPSVKLPPVQRRPKKAFRILPQGRTWGNEQGRGGNGPTIEQVARGS
ncbi:MAG: hypothetical protein WBG82_11035, partial [Parvibaculum sp.]|uniref:hypothetical protein n=1 Tax=Parvibaculum sp. TaxID=2024848 RepID=UPI003C75DB06